MAATDNLQTTIPKLCFKVGKIIFVPARAGEMKRYQLEQDTYVAPGFKRDRYGFGVGRTPGYVSYRWLVNYAQRMQLKLERVELPLWD